MPKNQAEETYEALGRVAIQLYHIAQAAGFPADITHLYDEAHATALAYRRAARGETL